MKVAPHDEEKKKEEEKEEKEEENELSPGHKRQFDPEFRGPIHHRSCTDVLFLIVFLVCIALLGVVAIFAYMSGDPAILLAPTDSYGHLCGRGNLSDRPYLFFFDLSVCASQGSLAIRGCPTPQICLAQCPQKDWFWGLHSQDNPDQVVPDVLCDYSVPQSSVRGRDLATLVAQGRCASYYFASRSLAGRCVANVILDGINSTKAIVMEEIQVTNSRNQSMDGKTLIKEGKTLSALLSSMSYGQRAFADLVQSWWQILLLVCVAACVSFLWCLLMQWFAGTLVYITLVGFFVLFLSTGAFSVYQYTSMAAGDTGSTNTNITFSLQKDLDSITSRREVWLVLGCVALLLAVVVGLVLLCLGSQIRLAVAVLGEASKAVAGIKTTLMFPLLPWLLQLVTFVLIGSVILYLLATGKAIRANNAANCTEPNFVNNTLKAGAVCNFVRYGGGAQGAYYLLAYAIFMGLWFLCFIKAMGQLILAGAFASWYWAWNKPADVPTLPLVQSSFRAVRYHMGTAALGSLLIAIVWMIRLLLEALERRLSSSENVLAKFLFCLLQCFFWCLNAVLKFITKNAFIVTAIHGRCFCFAAKDAFMLIVRNSVRLLVVDNVTDLILFVGKLLVTLLMGCLAYCVFYNQPEGSLNYFYVPVIVVLVGTWYVATLFFGVYSFAVDTLFICVMEDLERNDGSAEKPYFMSKSLRKVLDKKNANAPTGTGEQLKVTNDEKTNNSSCLFCCC